MNVLDRLEGAIAVTRHSEPKHLLRNHKAGIPLTASMITLTLLAACAGETPKPGAPLRDDPPYVCQVIPEIALKQVLLTDGSYEEHVNNDLGVPNNYSCDASADPTASVGITLREGSYAEFSYKNIQEDNPPDPTSEERLPVRMGEGWYTKEWSSNPGTETLSSHVWVYWRCGRSPALANVWLYGHPTEGRNASEDLVRLMEIVQERYSELNGDCEISPPEPVPTDPTSTSSDEEGIP